MPSLAWIALPLACGVLCCLLVHRLDRSRWAVRGVVGPYFAAPALLFGLFCSNALGDMWTRQARLGTLVTAEVGAMQALLCLGEAGGASATPVQGPLRALAAAEERAARAPDDPAAEAQAGEAIRALYALGGKPASFPGGSVVQAGFLAALERLRDARDERLHLRTMHLAPEKLLLVAVLGVLTQLAIAWCHAGTPRAIWLAVMLFSLAFTAAMLALVAGDQPHPVDPALYAEALQATR